MEGVKIENVCSLGKSQDSPRNKIDVNLSKPNFLKTSDKIIQFIILKFCMFPVMIFKTVIKLT